MKPLTVEDIDDMAKGFDALLTGQLNLQISAYRSNPVELTGKKMADFVRWNAYALINELVEATNEVGWKPWASSRHLNREAFARELIDLLHFFANLCLVANITGEDLAMAYSKKRVKNLERQKEGYDGIEGKCFNCGRDYSESRCYPTTSSHHGFCQEWV